MPYIKFIPYGDKQPIDISTTTDKEVQLWQEFSMLTHLSGPLAPYAKTSIAPWLEQAKVYYLDAYKSNWKSAGLLYYYSFLNLAKAFIVTKRAVAARTLKSTSIYHGLSAQAQNPSRLIDFNIEIHPPLQKGKRNIFALLYQKLTGQNWPFTSTINLNVADFVGYCSDISHELIAFYGIPHQLIESISITRDDNAANVWFEMLTPNTRLFDLQAELGGKIFQTVQYGDLTDVDKIEWESAHSILPPQFMNVTIVRINHHPYTPQNINAQYLSLANTTTNDFKGLILPYSVSNYHTNAFWYFVPKKTINGNKLIWHPLLSNYLFAFVLSTILRYHPHLLRDKSKDAFIAEAWCNQAATTTLRYFLMEMSNQKLRLN